MAKRALLWLVGLGPAIAALLAAAPSGPLADSPPYTGWRLLAAQALTAALLGLSLTAIHDAWRSNRSANAGGALFLAICVFLAGPIISAALGGHGGPWQQLLTAPLVFTAFFVGPRPPMTQLISDIRRIARIYMWGSLFALLVAPSWAVDRNMDSAILTDTRDWLGLGMGRLFGLTTHPNALGPIAALALAMELAPLSRRSWWLLHASAA